MDKDKVVVCQLWEVSGYMAANVVGLAVVLEVFMIGEDSNGMRGSCKEVTPVVETSDNSQEFAVVDVVVVLSFIECFGVIAHSLVFSSAISLCEDGSGGKC